MSDRQPIFILDAVRLQVDAVDWLVVLVPIKSEADGQAIMSQLIGFKIPIAFARRQENGESHVFCAGPLPEELRSRIDPDIQWQKIPIYPP